MPQMKRFELIAFVAAALTTTVAMAGAPPKLSCPPGTRQQNRSDVARCMKGQGKDARAHGPMVMFHRNGVKEAEGQTENGFRNGFWTIYDEQGVKTGEVTFKRGNFDGKFTHFHPNGKVKKTETYVKGLREGIAQEFSADGKLVSQQSWSNNKQLASK